MEKGYLIPQGVAAIRKAIRRHPKAAAARMRLAAFATLVKELGPRQALRYGKIVDGGDDPFADLGPPAEAKDRICREQIAPALRLYSALRQEKGQDEALRVVEKVVLAASLVFLDYGVGEIDPKVYLPMSEEERKLYLEQSFERFANAETIIASADDETFVHLITSCRFVTLCSQVGAPELAPLFCKGDLVFFAKGPISLERPCTLAEGAEHCEFRFAFRKGG